MAGRGGVTKNVYKCPRGGGGVKIYNISTWMVDSVRELVRANIEVFDTGTE